jgi:thioesterase domain-containing protein
MAQQLRAQGQEIALLILMDTPRPDLSLDLARRVRRRFRPIMESHIVRCLRDLTRHLHGRTFKEQISYLARKRDKVIPQLVGNRESSPSRNVGNPHAYVQRSYSRAIYRYRPKPYAGRLILLRHEETDRTDLTLGWKEFAHGGIELCTVEGNHNTYIREYVQCTAKRIREYLEGVDSKIFVAYWLSQGIANCFFEIEQVIML